MAAPATTPDLLGLIQKSGLYTADSLQALVENLPMLPTEAPKAAALLIKHGVLTSFQAKLLLAGRYRGFRLGPYLLKDQIGHGGMGAVYLAEHETLRRKVALKVLSAGDADKKLAIERFLREARSAAALDHPNIVRIFDVQQQNDMHYLVMEFVEGQTLDQIIHAGGPMAAGRAVEVITQAAAGLQHAYEKGFVHRDIKPGNIMVAKDGTVKILDMGLARSFDARDNLTAMLDKGAVVGTADYIAPEQAMNSPGLDIRADIYSLGATFFAIIAGRPPFDGNTTQKLMQHQMKEAPSLTLLDKTVPPELAAIVAKMMAKNPDDRFQTPAEVIDALVTWLPASGKAVAAATNSSISRGKLYTPSAPTGPLSAVITQADTPIPDAPISAKIMAKPVPESVEESEEPIERPANSTVKIPVPLIAAAAFLVTAAIAAGVYFGLPGATNVPLAGVTKPNPPATQPEPGPEPEPEPMTPTPPVPTPPNIETAAIEVAPAPRLVRDFRTVYDLDLSPLQPYTIVGHTVLKPTPTNPTAKQWEKISSEGDGAFPSGWSVNCWRPESETEGAIVAVDNRNTMRLRSIQGPGSGWLLTPEIPLPTGQCRVVLVYRTNGNAGNFHLKFVQRKPFGRTAWHICPLKPTDGQWVTHSVEANLDGATAGCFEIHNSTNSGPSDTIWVRGFTVSERTASPYPPLYTFDTASLRPFQYRVENRKTADGKSSAANYPQGVNGFCWKPETVAEFRCEDTPTGPILSSSVLSGPHSAQFAFELEAALKVKLVEGKRYEIAAEYRTGGKAAGVMGVQTQQFMTVARASLTSSVDAWRTGVVEFERMPETPLRLIIDAAGTVGEGNVLYLRKVELRELP